MSKFTCLAATTVVAGLLLGAPATSAFAATSPTSTPPASGAVEAPHVDAAISGGTATLTIAGTPGASVRVRDAAGRTVAGSALPSGRATVKLTIAPTESSFEIDQTVDGTVSTPTPITFHDGVGAQLAAPDVKDVAQTGSDRAVVTAAATPGSIVKVMNGSGTTIGAKVTNARGVAQVAVPVDAASVNELSAVQVSDAQQSEATDQKYVAKPTTVDVAGVFAVGKGLAARLSIDTPAKTQDILVVDEAGKRLGGGSAFNNPYGITAYYPNTGTPVRATVYAVVDSVRSEGVSVILAGEETAPAAPKLCVTKSTTESITVKIEAPRGLEFLAYSGVNAHGRPALVDSGSTITVYNSAAEGGVFNGNELTLDRADLKGDTIDVTLYLDQLTSTTESIAIPSV